MSEWQDIETAPKNCEVIKVKMKDGEIHEDVHWACDLSGEFQPPFKGFFRPYGGSGSGFFGISKPTHWMPLPPAPSEAAK